MVRPTKGGLDVRGVTFSFEALRTALAKGEALPPRYDDLLGAQLSVVARLVKGSSEQGSGDIVVQGRAGDWWRVEALISAQLVAKPQQIAGEVKRSKGYFAVGQYLVSPSDLAWSLQGGEALGKRVHLWGQPRTVQCDPRAQCLRDGALPLFDVGRAEFAP
jgi:hypothetical protein